MNIAKDRLKLLVLLALAAPILLFGVTDKASAYTYRVIHTFCQDNSTRNCLDGGGPQAGLVMDTAGNFYGTTHVGGSNNGGVIYELSPHGVGNWKYKVLYNFCSVSICEDGSSAAASLIIDAEGNLYGTTEEGGQFQNGTVFILKPNAKRTKWTLRVLHAFCPTENLTCSDGAFPAAGLTYADATSGGLYDGTSPLFGTTGFGGTHGWGTAFQIVPLQSGKRWKLKTLYNFCTLAFCADGAVPLSSLISDQLGNLFGTTSGNNNSGNQGGNVFELKPNVKKTRWIESVLYGFCALPNCTDGNSPVAPVIMGTGGNLWGVTDIGGASNSGVAFNLVSNGTQWQENLLYNFCSLTDCGDGSEPAEGAGLAIDTQGHLFGSTYWGGGNDVQQGGRGGGTIFELSDGYQRLYSFCSQLNCADGANPVGSLIVDGDGNIFGTASVGGATGPNMPGGTVFELTP